ncbi:MAG: AI-2E family transporter [Acidobacteria bacterium]|nr:AI-2E family transporter [Acidobacteriota bacterium]
MTTRPDTPRALIRYALVGLAVTSAVVWTLYLTRDAILLVYVSALVAIGLSPLVARLERRKLPGASQPMPRWAAILVIYACFIGVIVGVGLLVVPPLIEQARGLWSASPDMLHQAQQWLIDRGLLNRELSVREAVAQAPGGGTDTVGTIVGAVWGFLGGIFGVVTILILAFYLLLESSAIVTSFVRMFPRGERARVDDASSRVSSKVSAWLGGQLLLGGIIGGSAAIGLFLIGVPYFYVLALIAGIGELIPIVGPILAAVPAVAVAFTVSPTMALGVAVFFFVQQQLENHVLVPKVMSRQVGLNASFVIIALLFGGSLLGIVGAILAIPTAAILQVLFEEAVPNASSTD